MKDSLRVASWEIRKMLKNKTFIISVLLTPVIMLIFGALPTLLARLESDATFTLHVIDEIGLYEPLNTYFESDRIVLELVENGDIATITEQIRGKSMQGYIVLSDEIFATHSVEIVTGGDGTPNLGAFPHFLRQMLQQHFLAGRGMPVEEIILVTTPYQINMTSLTQKTDGWERYVPAIFAGLIIMSVYVSGMMTMQSAMAEKKDRMVEVLLSSVTPAALMQGKVIGYFALGLLQTMSWIVFATIAAYAYFKIPVLEYLWSPQLPVMLFFALTGYLLYSAILVGMGATIDDIATAGNFQGFVFMVPMLPIFFVGPVIANPNGVIAKIGTYFPLTSPGVMLLRLALSTTIGILEILGAAVIVVLTAWLAMRLAGKIFKVGMLMYGKNATPAEMLRWLRY